MHDWLKSWCVPLLQSESFATSHSTCSRRSIPHCADPPYTDRRHLHHTHRRHPRMRHTHDHAQLDVLDADLRPDMHRRSARSTPLSIHLERTCRGCATHDFAAVLTWMFGRPPLWYTYGDRLDGIVQLPSSMQEFALQVCDCAMTYLPELLLIEHMEDKGSCPCRGWRIITGKRCDWPELQGIWSRSERPICGVGSSLIDRTLAENDASLRSKRVSRS